LKKNIILFAMIIFLASVISCSHFGNDPDGDNDTKGINHFPVTRHATGNKVFIFDPQYRAWAVYDAHGHRVNTGRASGGSVYCPDLGRGCRTIVGTFRIISKGNSECISHSFPIETSGGAPMPYCMHFSPKGYAIHGSYHVPDYNASHGCIRITPIVAEWLNTRFMNIGSTVIVLPYH
jgi:lipoprotein-anchoring transpeptidase ErfK/SrfK